MDELPLVREIRAARQRLARVSDAETLLQRLQADQMTLSVLERKYASSPEKAAKVLPGAETLAQIGERFTDLDDLTTVTRTTPDRAMAERRRELDAVALALKPMVAEERAASSALHELRHDQHHQLKAPQYADAMAALTEIVTERDAVQNELNPRRARLAAVAPSEHLMEHLSEQLAWVNEPITGNVPVAAYRALAIGSGMLDVLRSCVKDTGFDLPVPESMPVPESPDADAAAEQLEWVRTQLGEVAALHSALRSHCSELEQEIQGLEERLHHHNQRIEEMLG